MTFGLATHFYILIDCVMDQHNLLQSQFSSVVGTSHQYFFHSLQNSKRLPAGGWPFDRHHGPFKKKKLKWDMAVWD